MRACRQPDFSIKHKFDIVFSTPFRYSHFRKGVGLDVCSETQLPPRSTGIIFLAFDLHCYRFCHARIECHIIAEDVGMYMTHTVVVVVTSASEPRSGCYTCMHVVNSSLTPIGSATLNVVILDK